MAKSEYEQVVIDLSVVERLEKSYPAKSMWSVRKSLKAKKDFYESK